MKRRATKGGFGRTQSQVMKTRSRLWRKGRSGDAREHMCTQKTQAGGQELRAMMFR